MQDYIGLVKKNTQQLDKVTLTSDCTTSLWHFNLSKYLFIVLHCIYLWCKWEDNDSVCMVLAF